MFSAFVWYFGILLNTLDVYITGVRIHIFTHRFTQPMNCVGVSPSINSLFSFNFLVSSRRRWCTIWHLFFYNCMYDRITGITSCLFGGNDGSHNWILCITRFVIVYQNAFLREGERDRDMPHGLMIRYHRYKSYKSVLFHLIPNGWCCRVAVPDDVGRQTIIINDNNHVCVNIHLALKRTTTHTNTWHQTKLLINYRIKW